MRPYVSRQLWAVIELAAVDRDAVGGGADHAGRATWTLPARSGSTLPAATRARPTGSSGKVLLGPRAQEVLRPWLRADPAEYLFQPREAKEEHLAERRRGRKTPLTPSQRARTRKPDPKKAPGDRYDTRTYNHAVARACGKAGVPRWHPHQLRHSAATDLRREFGVEVARVVLGHSSALTTEIYAESDRAKAVEAMTRVG